MNSACGTERGGQKKSQIMQENKGTSSEKDRLGDQELLNPKPRLRNKCVFAVAKKGEKLLTQGAQGGEGVLGLEKEKIHVVGGGRGGTHLQREGKSSHGRAFAAGKAED